MPAIPAPLSATVLGKLLAVGAGLMLAAVGAAPPLRTAPLSSPRPAAGNVPAEPVQYVAPLPLPLHVARGFDPPASPYGPGHLGVDLAVPPHTPIRSAGPGLVTFAGPVAGRGVVVVSHPDGVRTEYEPVRPLVHRGDEVQAGTVIAVLAGRHPGCPVAACLHWGARRDAGYIDPLSLLTQLGPVRLLPWDP